MYNPPTPHSWMPNSIAWNAKLGYAIPPLNGKFMAIYGEYSIKQFGVNFTSQSTTGMGHDIALPESIEYPSTQIEQMQQGGDAFFRLSLCNLRDLRLPDACMLFRPLWNR